VGVKFAGLRKSTDEVIPRSTGGCCVYVEALAETGRRKARDAWLRFKFSEGWRWVCLARQIDGWLAESEGCELFQLAKNHTPHFRPRVVELGSWKGKSSVLLAGGLLGKENPKLYCIDPFGRDESDDYQRRYYEPLLAGEARPIQEIFLQNMKDCGVAKVAVAIKGYSFDLAEGWSEPIDFLFIDANHEYEAAARDFRMWSPFVKEGGIVALHDANGAWPGPTRVVEEYLTPPQYGPVRRVASLAWAARFKG
jgi:predicted O-methyltransferase YrrM